MKPKKRIQVLDILRIYKDITATSVRG